MQVVDWSGKPVTVSEPWSQAPAGNRSLVGSHRSTAQRGIIFGVSAEVSESDVKLETGAHYVRRVLQATQLKLAVADRTKPEVEIWRRPKKSTSYSLLRTVFR